MAPRVRLLEHLITWPVVASLPAIVWLITGSPWLSFLVAILVLIGVVASVVYGSIYRSLAWLREDVHC